MENKTKLDLHPKPKQPIQVNRPLIITITIVIVLVLVEKLIILKKQLWKTMWESIFFCGKEIL